MHSLLSKNCARQALDEIASAKPSRNRVKNQVIAPARTAEAQKRLHRPPTAARSAIVKCKDVFVELVHAGGARLMVVEDDVSIKGVLEATKGEDFVLPMVEASGVV